MTVYYNEFDPFKAQWLRHLIEEGVIAKGVVDERPVQSVEPADLVGYDQHHFFAGIGVWSYALRRAGWPDDEPIWTGSCPCQPFSLAGKQDGFADPRHVWPQWFRLVRVCRPDRILGEQVASAGAWVDLVQSDLESWGYACGSPDLPAAGFGGAHIRQRFMWVADAHDTERWAERAPWNDGVWPTTGRIESHGHAAERSSVDRLAVSCDLQPRWGVLGPRESDSESTRPSCERSEGLCSLGGVDFASECRRPRERCESAYKVPVSAVQVGRLEHAIGLGSWRNAGTVSRQESSPGRSVWRLVDGPELAGAVDWLWCRDEKWRPVEPGTFPLVDASPQRVGRLRGYGDAIDAEALTQFIGAYMDALYDVF